MNEDLKTVYLLPGQRVTFKIGDTLIDEVGPKEISVPNKEYEAYVNVLGVAIDTKDRSKFNESNLLNSGSVSVIELNAVKDENIFLQSKTQDLEKKLSELQAQLQNANDDSKDKKSKGNA